MRSVPVHAHTRQVPSLIDNGLHRQLRNEVALLRLDRNLSAQIDAFMAQLASEDPEAAERIEQTGMV